MSKTILTIIMLAALLFVLSLPSEAQEKPIKLRVTSVIRNGNESQVIARSNRYFYKAICMNLPDSVKTGTILQAESFKGQTDCICLFKRR